MIKNNLNDNTLGNSQGVIISLIYYFFDIKISLVNKDG